MKGLSLKPKKKPRVRGGDLGVLSSAPPQSVRLVGKGPMCKVSPAAASFFRVRTGFTGKSKVGIGGKAGVGGMAGGVGEGST